MTLERITRRLNQNFTTISNEILRDASISLKAKALHITVMGLPSDWDFSIRGLSAIIKEGRDAIYSGLNELVDSGYVVRVMVRVGGKFSGYDYVFHASPYTEKPYTEKPYTEKPYTENPPQLRTQESRTQESTYNGPPQKFPLSELFAAFPDVQLTPSQCGLIESAVAVGDAEAWRQTIQKYKANYDPLLGRYDPSKVGNLLDVFRKYKADEVRNPPPRPERRLPTAEEKEAEYAKYSKPTLPPPSA